VVSIETVEKPAPSTAPSAAEQCLARVEWQSVVFSDRPRRLEVLRLEPSWERRAVHVRVLRNHAFELVATAAARIGSFSGLDLQWSIGEYDDSLSDVDVSNADVAVIWLDYDRFDGSPAKVFEWLRERLEALRGFGDCPVLLFAPQARVGGSSVRGGAQAGADDELRHQLEAAISTIPGVHVIDQSSMAADLGERYFDDRAAGVSGTRLSDAACLLTARELALRWLPAAAGIYLKAVAIDLDGTLYAGVLGEDGSDRIVIKPEHHALAEALLELRRRGVLLTLLSRNEPADVEALFARRSDLILRPEHFAATAISWEPKSRGLETIAEKLRIGIDAVLVVDDNPGELAEMASRLAGLKCLWADSEDPGGTSRALALYPGFQRLTETRESQLRESDMAAAGQRSRAFDAAEDPGAYLRSLHVSLTLRMNPRELLGRLAELTQKTNQFNTTLNRMNETEILQYATGRETRVVSAGLRDRLSDSGTIGVVAARRGGSTLIVDALAVSCRALGRGIETPLILGMLRGVVTELPVTEVLIPFTCGPRNDPARRWVTELIGDDPVLTGSSSLSWDHDRVDALLREAPVSIGWEHPHEE
jgi:FkbH-like protein